MLYSHEIIGSLSWHRFQANRIDNIAEFSLRAFSMAFGLKFSNLSYCLDSRWFGRIPSKELSSLHDLYFELQLTNFTLESCRFTRSWQNCIILFPSIFDMWISTKYFLSAVIWLHIDITTRHTSLAPQHIVGIYVRNKCIFVNTSSPSHGELFKASMLIQWGTFPGIRGRFQVP